MIEWNEEARRHWETRVPPFGKRMAHWVDKETWQDLHTIFGRFNSQDSWKALFATMNLFRKLATDTAQWLGYHYPLETDQVISAYVQKLTISP